MISSDAIERRNRTANSCIFIFPDSNSSTFAFVSPRRMDMKSAWVCLVVVLLFCSVAGFSWWSESVVVVVGGGERFVHRKRDSRCASCNENDNTLHPQPSPIAFAVVRQPYRRCLNHIWPGRCFCVKVPPTNQRQRACVSCAIQKRLLLRQNELWWLPHAMRMRSFM